MLKVLLNKLINSGRSDALLNLRGNYDEINE